MREIETINSRSFGEFGTILHFEDGDTEDFRIIDTEEEAPWRVAVFRYRNRTIRRIECHPTSKESFEPLSGISLLLVAAYETPEDYHLFLLDQPVVLKKGVWHQTLALSEEGVVKITENLEVGSVFYDLAEEVRIGAVQ